MYTPLPPYAKQVNQSFYKLSSILSLHLISFYGINFYEMLLNSLYLFTCVYELIVVMDFASATSK